MQLSFRLNEEDLKALKYLLEKDGRCETVNEKLRYVIEDAAKICQEITKDEWLSLKNKDIRFLDYIEIKENEICPKTFIVEDEAYETVIKTIKKSLDLSKMRVSFAIRLCIKLFIQNEQIKIKKEELTEEINIINVDGVYIINKISELLMKNDLSSKTKVKQIISIINN